MIAFGCVVGSDEKFRAYARRGIELVREPDSLVLERHGCRCIFRAYNEMLDEVAPRDDLEALVLLHEDAEILEPDLATRITSWLADSSVAIVGTVGARGVRSIAWWEADGTVIGCADFAVQADDGRELARITVPGTFEVGPGYVDAVDGWLMVLSPWAVRELRFDEAFGPGFHGYDIDICFQARARGKRVIADGIRAVHHHVGRSLRGSADRQAWMRAHIAFADKWEARGMIGSRQAV